MIKIKTTKWHLTKLIRPLSSTPQPSAKTRGVRGLRDGRLVPRVQGESAVQQHQVHGVRGPQEGPGEWGGQEVERAHLGQSEVPHREWRQPDHSARECRGGVVILWTDDLHDARMAT